MKALIVYDSFFGNTEKIAQAIGEEFGEDTLVLRPDKVSNDMLVGLDYLVVGSPTRAFRATKDVNGFLGKIPGKGLTGVKVAGFDTRMDVKEVKSGILSTMVRFFGYAAEPIGKKLVQKGGVEVVKPEGFVVLDTEGPLKDGELERAKKWAKQVLGA